MPVSTCLPARSKLVTWPQSYFRPLVVSKASSGIRFCIILLLPVGAHIDLIWSRMKLKQVFGLWKRADDKKSFSILHFTSFHSKLPTSVHFHFPFFQLPSFPFSFLFQSSFCPPISPYFPISPDSMPILILLPHGSITHFSHFCIYTKERGAPLFFLKPPPKSSDLQSHQI